MFSTSKLVLYAHGTEDFTKTENLKDGEMQKRIHENKGSKSHRDSSKFWKEAERRMTEGSAIDNQMTPTERKIWQDILSRIIEGILHLAKRDIRLRGYRESLNLG